MTIHQFPRPAPSALARSGEPWTTEDYELLLSLCREGADDAEIATQLQRSQNAVQQRAKRLLPVDQRGVPSDRVLLRLAKLQESEEEYDWEHHLAATPPPRPVVNHVHPPAVRTGIEGLEDDELLAMAGALAQLREVGPAPYLGEACGYEIVRRGLVDELEGLVTRSAQARVEAFLRGARYPYSSSDCWAMSRDHDARAYEPPHSFFLDQEPPWEEWEEPDRSG